MLSPAIDRRIPQLARYDRKSLADAHIAARQRDKVRDDHTVRNRRGSAGLAYAHLIPGDSARAPRVIPAVPTLLQEASQFNQCLSYGAPARILARDFHAAACDTAAENRHSLSRSLMTQVGPR